MPRSSVKEKCPHCGLRLSSRQVRRHSEKRRTTLLATRRNHYPLSSTYRAPRNIGPGGSEPSIPSNTDLEGQPETAGQHQEDYTGPTNDNDEVAQLLTHLYELEQDTDAQTLHSISEHAAHSHF